MDILNILRNNDVTSEIIKDLIAEHTPKAAKMKRMYEAYKGSVPINSRQMPDETKINSKLANDYRGDIIDLHVGYLFGKPLTYQLDKNKYQEAEYNKVKDMLSQFQLYNNLDDLDSTTGKMSAICGYAARLLYIDREGKERVMDVNPWECIFIEDGSINEQQLSLRYYDVEVKEGGVSQKRTKVEWYDDTTITYYIQNNGGEYVLDNSEPINPQLNGFNFNPLVEYVNNDEKMGDFEKVEPLINAYDRTLSDAQNEIEEFRQAYMLFKGVMPDEETIIKARQSGAFGMDSGDDVTFLTKQLNDTFLENHKKTLNDNIYKFSKSVDMASESFSGSSASGESRKWRLLGLENKVVTKERKFVAATRQMFKVISSAWATKGINVNPLDIFVEFKRNIPVELKMEGEVVEKFKGVISDRTLLSLLSFIDDVDYEIELIEAQKEEYIDLDEVEVEEVGQDIPTE